MKVSKRKKLEAAGWKLGSASEFLELSDAEEMLVNMKLALAANVKIMRQQKRMTQQELAKRIGSSQSRVAKMEVADRSVSMELFVRSLAALGASRAQIGKIVGTRVVKQKPTTTSTGRLVKTQIVLPTGRTSVAAVSEAGDVAEPLIVLREPALRKKEGDRAATLRMFGCHDCASELGFDKLTAWQRKDPNRR